MSCQMFYTLVIGSLHSTTSAISIVPEKSIAKRALDLARMLHLEHSQISVKEPKDTLSAGTWVRPGARPVKTVIFPTLAIS